MVKKKPKEPSVPLFGVKYVVTFFDDNWEPIQLLTRRNVQIHELLKIVYVFSLHAEAMQTELSGWKSEGREVCSMSIGVDDGEGKEGGNGHALGTNGGEAKGT